MSVSDILRARQSVVTNAEALRDGCVMNSLRLRKPEGSLGRTAQDGHLDSHTAPELCVTEVMMKWCLMSSDVSWHIRDKSVQLWPAMPKHVSISNSLCPRKPEGLLGWRAQDGHLDSHTAPELCVTEVDDDELMPVNVLRSVSVQIFSRDKSVCNQCRSTAQ